ncbi:TRAP transporter large permease subunit, partial [Rhodovarius crocodyli]
LITETSVGALYIAALFPSLLVVALFVGLIAWHGVRNPLPKPPPIPLREKLIALKDLTPTVLLIVLVLGSIYGGYATPTEAAALG